MTKQDFINLFIEKLNIVSSDLTLDTELNTLEEWDSWNKLTLMGMVDEYFQINLSANDLREIIRISDLINKIGSNKFSE